MLLGKVVPKTSCLLVCDIQERFRDLIFQMPSVIQAAKHLITVSRELDFPCIATEQPRLSPQNPRVLLPSVHELNLGVAGEPGAVPTFAKQKFSMITEDVLAHLKQKMENGAPPEPPQPKGNVILCGIEAHVCVLQTCLDLLEHGYAVHVVVDGVSSQRPLDRAVALRRMQQVGAYLTTVEAITFQLMGTADDPRFRKISNLVKEHAKGPQEFAGMETF